jgi:hypothetical protein
MTLPANLQPATFGVCHGSGFFGAAIRKAQMRMSNGDHEASWAGHCVVYVGKRDFAKVGEAPDIDHAIVEAEYPKVVLSRASRHQDTIWATGQPLTAAQRKVGVLAALTLLGHQYDLLAYAYFMAKVAHLGMTNDLKPLFTATAAIGPICSGVVVRTEEKMKVDLGPLSTAATADPDFVCPADCLRWGLDNHWMSSPVPPW